jgi:hypothetical protein
MWRPIVGIFLSCVLLPGTLLGQQVAVKTDPLQNKDIVEMLQAGLTPEIVIAKIESSKCEFDTSPGTLRELKIANVPDAVILAMVKTPPPRTSNAGPLVSDQNPPVTEQPADEKRQEAIQKATVFVTDSQSWSAVGFASVSKGAGFGGSVAGSSPQTVEVIHDFAKQCPNVMVTNDREKASYVVLFDRDANAAIRNKIAVFKRDGDLVFSGKTHAVANAVKDACAALTKQQP